MSERSVSNADLAEELEEIAELLELEDANTHRVWAYRNAARSIRQTERQLSAIYEQDGEEGLREISGIGPAIGSLLGELIRTGRSSLHKRLESEISPRELFEQVPMIGEKLSQSIVEQLGIKTLEELEQAAHDGRLEEVEGFGTQRTRMVRANVAEMLDRIGARREEPESGPGGGSEEPGIEALLRIDRDYRAGAENGSLRKIAPKRFNPSGEAWLPIMKDNRDGWQITALYSNTARAHELGKTDDWVVIYFKRNRTEKQRTVVTESRGPLRGLRVVRGREKECREYYRRTGEIDARQS